MTAPTSSALAPALATALVPAPPPAPARPLTVVAFNAHPDDEALLMAGTLALAARAGHRVVLVTATDGDLGLADAAHGGQRDDDSDDEGGQAALLSQSRLGARRLAELAASARAMGAARVVHLGYADSGHDGALRPDPPGRRRFVRVPAPDAAAALAEVLAQEGADVLIGYDERGGYGHRDHVHAHHVARAAAAMAGTPRLLEATFPRGRLARAVRLVDRLYPLPPGVVDRFALAGTPEALITHRVDIRPVLEVKLACLAAHASQATSPSGAPRTLGALLALPRPLQRLVLRHEWLTEPGRPARIEGGTL